MRAQHLSLETKNSELKSYVCQLEAELKQEKAAKQVCLCASKSTLFGTFYPNFWLLFHEESLPYMAR